MDNSDLSASRESGILPESEQEQRINVTTFSTEEHKEAHDITSKTQENATKMGGSEADKAVSKVSEVARAQEFIPGVVSSDFVDKNTENGEQLAETPVCSKHSENTSVEKIVENKDTRENEQTRAKNINETEITQDIASKPDPTQTLDSSQNNINIINKSDNVTNEQNEDRPSDIDDSTNNQDNNNSPHYIKWIMWKGVKTPIVTQNDNGPCPLLAIINILLLRRTIEFPRMQEMVTTQQLMDYLGDVVLKEIPQNMPEGTQRNFEQNMQDALSILPKLKTGLDVNVKFTGVGDFEFTPECVIFDLLNIKLHHGWLVDPQSTEYKAAIGNLSYNQLVEKIVASNESNGNSQLSSEGLLAESFLAETANQLTYHGVCELNAKLNDDELCVFFRNNHFSTLYKHQCELFLLLTDQGFLTEEKIIWQTLSSVDGDGVFVDYNFKSLPMRIEPVPSTTVTSESGALSQEDQDYMLALSIQNEQQPALVGTPNPAPQEPQESQSSNDPMIEQELFDYQYAMQLQEEEEATARTGRQQQQQPQRRAGRRQTPPPTELHPHGNIQHRNSDRGCVIL